METETCCFFFFHITLNWTATIEKNVDSLILKATHSTEDLPHFTKVGTVKKKLMCDKLRSVKVKVIYARCIKGDYRWGVLPLLEFSTNMVVELL